MIECDVAVVGGGFSGCAVAVQLARRADPDLSLALFEPAELGRGAAYGSQHAEHILNTRARSMSLDPDDPDHFVRWLGARGGPMDFISRRLYGDYVAAAATRAFERPRFSRVADRVDAVRRGRNGRFVVETSLGPRYEARAVVFATGNVKPNVDFLPREVRRHPGFVADPWRFDYRKIGGHVLLVGSGLTALDALVALDACAHRGAVYIVSRRGRFPEVHADIEPYDVVPALDGADARSIVRSFRRHVRAASARGFDWRAVLDAIRPESEAIWRRLSALEQQRFERHVRVHWERHRHRAPQQVDAVRERYRRSGRLTAYSGRLVAMEGGRATLALAGGARVELRPDWIVNCTGPGRSVLPFEPGTPSIRSNPNLTAIDREGRPIAGLWIAGPPARGSRFEVTAVPELRVMAAQVASDILAMLDSEAWADEQAHVGLASGG
jgi:uncharacterized NAD(P)/FAD-binding protein YdhS